MRIQKGKPRFSKRELWNLDETLKPIIHTALTQFKETKRHGVASEVTIDYIVDTKNMTHAEAKAWVAENRNQYGEFDEYPTEMMFDYFNNVILEDMIFAFANHPDYDEVEKPPYKITMNMDGEQREDGTRRSFIEYIWDDGVTQDDVNEYHAREVEYDKYVAARSERGRLLFARHFNTLWD